MKLVTSGFGQSRDGQVSSKATLPEQNQFLTCDSLCVDPGNRLTDPRECRQRIATVHSEGVNPSF